MESLYLHFPFCETKCHYCDFYSLGANKTKKGDPDLFEEAILTEIELQKEKLSPTLKTIFLGGGTPSMTPPVVMGRIFEKLFRYTSLAPDAEWTMEGNPSSLENSQLKEYRQIGLNRLSMGVQSLDDATLKMLGRVHDRAQVFRALENAFGAGFTNVSCDLLCGIPGQSLKDLEFALTELTRYPIQHLSCYLLTLAQHHSMYSKLPNEDEQMNHLLFVDQWMRDRGFVHYEISNYAKPGLEAKHNLHYWKGSSYLGLGPSAHSFDASLSQRWKNVSSLHKYSELLSKGQTAVEWTETLTPEQRNLEKWMLALRLAEGFPKDWLKSHSQIEKSRGLTHRGLMEEIPNQPSHYRLTARGLALSDQIIQELAE